MVKRSLDIVPLESMSSNSNREKTNKMATSQSGGSLMIRADTSVACASWFLTAICQSCHCMLLIERCMGHKLKRLIDLQT